MDGKIVEQTAEGFRKMVAKAAYNAWIRLPAHTRIWVSLEDLIQEGMNWVQLVGVPQWNPERSKHLSTFVHVGINNLFYDSYGRGRGLRTEERGESKVVSFEDLMTQYDVHGRKPDIDGMIQGKKDQSVQMVRECSTVPLVTRVYERASRNLKEELTKWFLTAERLSLKTAKFTSAKNEFRKLAKKEGLGIEDCRHLMNSPTCLDDLSRRLRWVPYDLNTPTPAIG